MKIDQLIEREPFGPIIERTLKRYLDQRYGGSHQVTWSATSSRVHSSVRAKEEQVWYCNPRLNALFAGGTEPDVLRIIYEHYHNTPFRHRRLIQQWYVRAATCPALARLFTSHTLDVSPGIPRGSWLLMTGGNNRIRLLDLQRRTVCSVLKDGFNPDFIGREIAVRRYPGSWPIPQLLEVAGDQSWFEESLVGGVPLNRLPPNVDTAPFEREAFRVLGDFLELTRVEEPLSRYVGGLTHRVHDKLRASRFVQDAERGRALSCVARLSSLAQEVDTDGGAVIGLAVGHGDFQPGNIMVESGRIWLLDWEHSGRRQLCYDQMVYVLRSRFPSGLANRIRSFVQHSQHFRDGPLGDRNPNGLLDQGQRRMLLAVFLLEEFLWYLEEIENPLFVKPHGGWRLFGGEVEEAAAAIAA